MDSNLPQVPQRTFSLIDYALVIIMLTFSVLIGIYYGYFSKKQNTANEYLLGGQNMKVFPVAMSIIASNTSGISLLAVPTDIYIFGATYQWISLTIILTYFIGIYVFVPVFLKLKGSSVNEYLQLRFDNKIRILGSFLSTLYVFLYNPIVIYIPALAFAQATGINLHLITSILCIICIFYTTIGGLKAVIWADTLQSLSIALSVVAVLILGIISVGGFSNIWTKCLEGHRLDIFDFNIDPTLRDTFWTITIGGNAMIVHSIYVNQAYVQRFRAVPSLHDAKKAIFIFCIGKIGIEFSGILTGLIMFTKYSECDPLTTKQVIYSDQLLAYYVMDVAGKIPGLPGLFITGIISAGLSTLSTTLNSLAATIYEDFISPFMPPGTTQKKANNIMKLIILITGAISTALVFVVEQLGGILPLILSIGGITSGPLLGLFCLGLLFPFANSKGALLGGIGSLIFTSWVVIGNQFFKTMGVLQDFSKPLSTTNCNFYVNVTLKNKRQPHEPVLVLYRISFWYYTFLGTVVVIIIGLVVSWFTRKNNPQVNPDLISPFLHFLLPKKNKSENTEDENSLRLLPINN